MLRFILAIVATANLYAAYMFFFTPEIIGVWYRMSPIDNTHRFLTMIIGSLLAAFGVGAIVAMLRPLKYSAIIIMLLLMHFMVFLIDVIVLARGQMPFRAILPEMIYFLIMSTALVRWYPVRGKEAKESKEENEAKESKEENEADEMV